MREYARRYRERHRDRVLARERELYSLNPDKYREKSRRVRQERSPEYAKTLRRIQYLKNDKRNPRNKEYQKAYRQRHHESVLASQRAYAEKNREKIRERNRRYRSNNAEKLQSLVKRAKHARRAREASAAGKFTVEDIRKLNTRQRGCCYWCQVNYGKTYHIDHVWPLVRGGSNGPENLVLACPTCNVRKNAKTPLEFAGRLL